MPESGASLLGRIIALVAGLAILVAGAFVSWGLVLVAPLGTWALHRSRRTRGRTLDLWGSWVSAVSATALALLLVAGTFAARVPADTWSSVRHAADSASTEAAKRPPPAWLKRIAPAANGYSAPAAPRSSAFNAALLIWGAGMGVGLFAAFLGTVGWGGTALLVFGASGHWFRQRSPVEIDLDVA